MVNGEIDRIAMNRFQQLLWEPTYVWKYPGEHETTNNSSASNWGLNNGKKEVQAYLLALMKEKWKLT